MTEPYYSDPWVTLYHGDCLEVMRSMPDESVDLVVTSPPYNMFPLALPLRCIEATGATSVLDPFSGSGTTLRAAKLAGIAGVGIDNEKRWCDLSVRRLAQDSLDFTEETA